MNSIRRSRAAKLVLGILTFIMLMLVAYVPMFSGNYHLHCDSTKPAAIRQFDQKALEKYKKRTVFKYDKFKSSFNLKSWLLRNLEKFLSKLFSRPIGEALTSRVFYYSLYVFAGIAVILIILQLLRFTNVFNRRKGKLKLTYQEVEEDINEMKFDQLIRDAIEKGNYRYAIRLHYLRTLKDLSDRSLIAWKPEKTNLQYIQEMSRHPDAAAFEQLTDIFDWVWYGEFEVDAQNYTALLAPFDQFHHKLTIS